MAVNEDVHWKRSLATRFMPGSVNSIRDSDKGFCNGEKCTSVGSFLLDKNYTSQQYTQSSKDNLGKTLFGKISETDFESKIQ